MLLNQGRKRRSPRRSETLVKKRELSPLFFLHRIFSISLDARADISRLTSLIPKSESRENHEGKRSEGWGKVLVVVSSSWINADRNDADKDNFG